MKTGLGAMANKEMSTWKMDPAHTDILFSAKHMMVTTVRGKFNVVEGELALDEAEPTSSRGEMRVAAASLSTGVQRRDDRLRSADFLDVEHHPWVVARATGIERTGAHYRVHVDLAIRDETHPVTLEAKLNRKDWGLNWNMALEAGGWLVGEEVSLEIDVAADEVVAAGAAA